MTEYNTDVHTLSMAADYAATENLNLNGSLMFNDASADWTELSLTMPEYVDDAVVLNLYTFEGVNVMQNYSDLSYQQLELTLGGTYYFTPALYTTASATFDKFIDDDPYVYGDQDGTAYRGYLGMGYNF